MLGLKRQRAEVRSQEEKREMSDVGDQRSGRKKLDAGIEEAEGRGRKAEVNVEHRTSNVE